MATSQRLAVNVPRETYSIDRYAEREGVTYRLSSVAYFAVQHINLHTLDGLWHVAPIPVMSQSSIYSRCYSRIRVTVRRSDPHAWRGV